MTKPKEKPKVERDPNTMAQIAHCRMTPAELVELKALCAEESARTGLTVRVASFIRRATLRDMAIARTMGTASTAPSE